MSSSDNVVCNALGGWVTYLSSLSWSIRLTDGILRMDEAAYRITLKVWDIFTAYTIWRGVLIMNQWPPRPGCNRDFTTWEKIWKHEVLAGRVGPNLHSFLLHRNSQKLVRLQLSTLLKSLPLSQLRNFTLDLTLALSGSLYRMRSCQYTCMSGVQVVI